MRICAGIVLFHPDIDRLKQNIEAILPQADKLYLINNAPEDADELLGMFSGSINDKTVLINNDKNLGIAGALNQLLTVADNDGFEWILTLDQDSICSEGMVGKLSAAAAASAGINGNAGANGITGTNGNAGANDIAMIAPKVIERGIVWEDVKRKDTGEPSDVEETAFCITSGTLTNIAAVRSAGGFDERLFIDEVDRDICIRLRYKGYRLLRVNTAELNHEFGLELVHRKIFFRTYSYRNYAPFRVYYQIRNLVYMVRRYGADYKTYPAWRLVRPFFTFFVKFIFEPQRLARLSAFVRGYAAGLRMKAGE